MLDQPWPCYRVFGITLASDFPFTYPLLHTTDTAEVTFTCINQPPLLTDWSVLTPITHYACPAGKGVNTFQLYQLVDCLVVRLAGVGDFYLWAHEILCHLAETAEACNVELYFLGRVLALWQENRNRIVLHAAAVIVNGQAIAFIANSGSGKSGLASAFLQAGAALLTDDILALQRAEPAVPEQGVAKQTVFYGQPGYPQMRMWPEQAEYFLGGYEHLPLLLPTITKRRVTVGDNGEMGAFCPQPMPLAAIYLLERSSVEEHRSSSEIIPLPPTKAIVPLIAHCFAAVWNNGITTQQQRLKRLLPVVQQIPVRRLLYPSGFEYLAQVRQTVLEDIRNSS